MQNNISRSFILKNSLAAVSVTFFGGGFIATDGIECRIHRFDENGRYVCCGEAVRPYRRIRVFNGCATALGCDCGDPKLYLLDENLDEYDYVRLDISGCGCSCGCEDFGEMTDASLTTIGNEIFIIGVFRSSAYLFDSTGKRLTKLCGAVGEEILTDFISLGNDIFSMSTLNKSVRTVTVRDNGRESSAILERGHTLRMLFEHEGDIYGLFGKNYIYNRIIKIYSDGTLILPKPSGIDCE